MKLTIIAVGRLKAGPELALVETYRARLHSAPARVGPLTLHEIDERKDARTQERAIMEAISLLAPSAKLVALDERASSLASRAFAERLAAWRDDGAQEVAFLIGGADGLSAPARAKAHLKLGFGSQTWPHLLARAMLAEQLYRAASLLAGHPYHRE
jgi:23S rRNA (pseudouridine1915-N3)-methyltransferase